MMGSIEESLKKYNYKKEMKNKNNKNIWKIEIKNQLKLFLFIVIMIFSISINFDSIYGAKLVVYDKENCTNGDAYFSTISGALSSANEGDIIIVCPGRYTEQITINKPVKIEGYSRANVNIVHQFTQGYTIKISANNVVLKNLTIISDGKYNIYWVRAINIKGSNITLSDIQMFAPFQTGIFINESENVAINSIVTRYVGNSGKIIYSANSKNITISNSKFFVSSDEHVIELENTSASMIANNYIISLKPEVNINPFGIALLKGSRNNVILNNTIYLYKGGYCINVSDQSSSNNIIYNNYLYCSIPANDQNAVNVWNTSKMLGKNIVGGSYLCGNFWGGTLGYKGSDTDGDTLGDTNVPFRIYNPADARYYIAHNGDYCPLILIEDSAPPVFAFIEPTPEHGSIISEEIVVNISMINLNLNWSIKSCSLIFNGKEYRMNLKQSNDNSFYCYYKLTPKFGYNEFYAVIQDSGNNTIKTESRGFYYLDNTPPIIKILSPIGNIFSENYVFINIILHQTKSYQELLSSLMKRL